MTEDHHKEMFEFGRSTLRLGLFTLLVDLIRPHKYLTVYTSKAGAQQRGGNADSKVVDLRQVHSVAQKKR